MPPPPPLPRLRHAQHVFPPCHHLAFLEPFLASHHASRPALSAFVHLEDAVRPFLLSGVLHLIAVVASPPVSLVLAYLASWLAARRYWLVHHHFSLCAFYYFRFHGFTSHQQGRDSYLATHHHHHHFPGARNHLALTGLSLSELFLVSFLGREQRGVLSFHLLFLHALEIPQPLL
ncbi:hypothetical protein BKA80DRAFT_130411 [Phyllosticta citrichinensis]